MNNWLDRLIGRLPGIIAALAAYAFVRLFDVLALQNWLGELALFLVIYLVLVFLLERAFKAYGERN